MIRNFRLLGKSKDPFSAMLFPGTSQVRIVDLVITSRYCFMVLTKCLERYLDRERGVSIFIYVRYLERGVS